MKHLIIPGVLLLLFSSFNLTAQWVQMNNGLENIIIISFATRGNIILAGSSGYGIYLSSNNGSNWNWTQNILNNRIIYTLDTGGSNIFAGSNSGVFKSTNFGSNWTQTSLNNQIVYSLLLNGSNIFAGTNHAGIFKSIDYGVSWVPSGLSNLSKDVMSLAVNGNNIFAGTVYIPHPGTYPPGVHLSPNNGINWYPGGLINELIYALAVNRNNVYVGTLFDGVYFSPNNDTNWIHSSLNNQSVYDFAVYGDTIFAGTIGGGVYVTFNNCTSWIQINEGLGNLNVRALCIFNNYIFAGTSNSVYRRSLSQITGIPHVAVNVPDKFSLSQNYPNPFNPVTKIKFDIPPLNLPLTGGDGHGVVMKVYDILGKEVTTLVNEQLKPSTYEVEWDATNYPSGVYYYRLITGSYTDTKKMVLVK